MSSSTDTENRTDNDGERQRPLAEVWNSMTTVMYKVHTHTHIHRDSLCYFWRGRLNEIMKIQARQSHNTGGLVDSRMEGGRKSSGDLHRDLYKQNKVGEKLGVD